MIPEATIDQVRTAVNIADYIGQFVSLHKSGQNLFGICPFHDEKTPSFSVNESKQIFHCFSCGRGGNVFKFVMEYDHLSFPEAVAKVADFAQIPLGVTIQSQKPAEDPVKTRQKAILADVKDLCHHILVNTKGGEQALAYLHQRKLTDQTINQFEIGYVPAQRTLIRSFLESRNVTYDEQRQTGLFSESSSGELLDRFNDRVMFPIKDAYGDVIGFSGRILQQGEQQAKYLNSPETVLFNKRDVLFNLDHGKDLFRQQGGAILFEGFMDVISAFQAGVETGVASMGTSLTQEQVQSLSRHTKKLTVCYDGDAPGQKATDRAVSMLADYPQLDLGVVVLPGEMDPDEFIKANGAKAFQAQMQKVLTPIGFRLNFLAQGKDLTFDQDKLTYIDQALQEVAKAKDEAARAVYLQQVSDLVQVPVASLKQSLPQAKPLQAAPVPQQPASYAAAPPEAEPAHFDRFERAARQLLYLTWSDAALTRRLHQQGFVFPDERYQTLFDAWQNFLKAHENGTTASFLDTLDDKQAAFAADILMQNVPETGDAQADDMIKLLNSYQSTVRLKQIKQQLSQAQQLGDTETAKNLLNQYINLLRAYKKAQQAL